MVTGYMDRFMCLYKDAWINKIRWCHMIFLIKFLSLPSCLNCKQTLTAEIKVSGLVVYFCYKDMFNSPINSKYK